MIWLVVGIVGACCAVSFMFGFAIRGEIDLYRRARRPETLDFTRSRLGS